jgi:predicted Kef-type K+ transport protein
VIDQLKTQTPRYVAVTAIVLVGLAFVLGGPVVGTGALIGGVVATLDAWAITWLAKRIVTGAGLIGSGMAAALLGVKLVTLLAVCWALLARWGADPLGFSVGLGALVIGMLLAGVDLSVREAQAARSAQVAGEG